MKRIFLLLVFLLLVPFCLNAQLNLKHENCFNRPGFHASSFLIEDIVYDSTDRERQCFDLFLPDTTDNFPLLMYFHAGGFIRGNKDNAYSLPERKDFIKFFLDHDVAFATIGYRLLSSNASQQGDTLGVLKCFRDARRSLQFIRLHAESLHIDPEKIALYGISSGAGISLWIGMSPDMADMHSNHTVEQMSTRISAIAVKMAQATYDICKWETEVFKDTNASVTAPTLTEIIDFIGFERISDLYGGMASIGELENNPRVIAYRDTLHIISLFTKDDPPLYIESLKRDSQLRVDYFHHPMHAKCLYDHASQAGLTEVNARIEQFGIDNTHGESMKAFLLKHLIGDNWEEEMEKVNKQSIPELSK